MTQNKEIKITSKSKIIRFIYENKTVSRQDIANNLAMSLPTVFSNINELLELGILAETGEYASTGGRKAKQIVICSGRYYSIGVDITKNHIRFLLFDISGKAVTDKTIRYKYKNEQSYYNELILSLNLFIKDNGINSANIVGVGFSIPGIVDAQGGMLLRSHILEVAQVNLRFALKDLKYPYIIENDSNCAAYAEIDRTEKNAVYFSLNYSLGGTCYIAGKQLSGDSLSAGEFGHMILYPKGKRCYCGKEGCLDAYCSANALLNGNDETLEEFFRKLSLKETYCIERWDEYLENIAIAITNMRMALDCEVILGGYVASYIKNWLDDLFQKVAKYNSFSQDCSYIRIGKYQQFSSSIGAAMMALTQFFDLFNDPNYIPFL